MKLAVQLLSGSGSPDICTAMRLMETALSQGHEVSLFLMEDAVTLAEHFRSLTEKGAEVALCAHNAHQRGVVRVDHVLWGSQHDWAQLVHDADRVVSLG